MQVVRIIQVVGVGAALLFASATSTAAALPDRDRMIAEHAASFDANLRDRQGRRLGHGRLDTPTFAAGEMRRPPETTGKDIESINVALRFGPADVRYDLDDAVAASSEDRFGLTLPQPMRGAGIFATLALVIFFFVRRLS